MEYNNYKKSYDVNLINRWKDGEMDVEILRGLFYGDTCTHGYAMDLIEDALFMDYWRDKHFDEEGKEVEELDFYEVDTPQEHLLMEVLDSTGDGKTSETAICVISVDQEYEYLERKFPYNCLHVARQSLCDGIECLYFEENVYGIKCIYFDIKR